LGTFMNEPQRIEAVKTGDVNRRLAGQLLI